MKVCVSVWIIGSLCWQTPHHRDDLHLPRSDSMADCYGEKSIYLDLHHTICYVEEITILWQTKNHKIILSIDNNASIDASSSQ